MNEILHTFVCRGAHHLVFCISIARQMTFFWRKCNILNEILLNRQVRILNLPFLRIKCNHFINEYFL